MCAAYFQYVYYLINAPAPSCSIPVAAISNPAAQITQKKDIPADVLFCSRRAMGGFLLFQIPQDLHDRCTPIPGFSGQLGIYRPILPVTAPVFPFAPEVPLPMIAFHQ